MNPFYFGDSEEALFGVHHPPIRGKHRSQAILLCPPFGQEHMRSHRALRQLATALSKQGFHVLRFDYYGTGDSAGSDEEISVAHWTRDIAQAATELEALSDTSSLILLGLRFGATLALLSSKTCPFLHSLILWDPILSGSEYLPELLKANLDIETHRQWTEADLQSALAGLDTSDTLQAMGFPLPKAFREELAALDRTLAHTIREDLPYRLFSSSANPKHQAFVETLQKQGVDIQWNLVESPGNWCEVDNFGSVLIPQQMIQAIGQRCGEWYDSVGA